MKVYSKLILSLCLILGCLNCKDNKIRVKTESKFQKQTNALFKDATQSPLKPEVLKGFKSLPFFPIDSSFVVVATVQKTPKSEFFDMKTTTSRLLKERVFGVLTFVIKGKSYNLNLYQSKRSISAGDVQLFLPFFDDTNGLSTYGGGRYMDLEIPETDQIYLDFNKAYNPYCAYNERYSCPLVPRENYIPLKIKAGVMYTSDLLNYKQTD